MITSGANRQRGNRLADIQGAARFYAPPCGKRNLSLSHGSMRIAAGLAWLTPVADQRRRYRRICLIVRKLSQRASEKQSPPAHDEIAGIGIDRVVPIAIRQPTSATSSTLRARARRPVISSCASARFARSVSNRSAQHVKSRVEAPSGSRGPGIEPGRRFEARRVRERGQREDRGRRFEAVAPAGGLGIDGRTIYE
jgi:hypothetical protein